MLRVGKGIRIGFLLGIIFFVAGCALQLSQPQQVKLAPRLSLAPVKIGAGAKVYVTVADERGTNVLGYKTDSYIAGRGKITTSDDLRAIYQKALSDALANFDFNVLASPDPAAPNLEVSLVRFLYMGPGPNPYVVSKSYITAAATARVRRQAEALGGQNAALVHEKSYEVYHHSRTVTQLFFVEPSPGEVEERINAALSELISKLLLDMELLTFLKATGLR